MRTRVTEDRTLSIEQAAERLQVAPAAASRWIRQSLSMGTGMDRGLTIEETAARLNLSPATMRRWLRRQIEGLGQ